MQSANMDIDNSGGGRVRGAGGIRRGTARAQPYARAAPAADPSGKWQHDLFSSSSSLYNPVVNLPALASRGLAVNTSSASLRPFGAATPAPQIYTNQQARVTAIPTGPAAMQANGFGAAAAAAAAGPTSLTERLGIKGRKNSEAVAERQRQQAIAERERKEKADLQRAAEARNKAAIEARRLAEANWNRLSTIAKEEDMGFVVQVEGLVYGTSADDVQTAFSAYGDTSFCFVLNELTATETDDLIARLTFKVHADAVDACTKLNGAVADGRPLRVQQVARTPHPAPLPPSTIVVAPAALKTKVKGALPTGPRVQNGIPTGPKAGGLPARPRAAPAAAAAPPASTKMYADLVSPTDPRISSSSFIDLSQDPDDGMEVDSNSGPASRGYQPIPSGPRRAKKAGNNGPIPTGPKAGNQAQQQQQGSGLLARFGVSQPTTKGGQQGKGGAAAGGGSLLARLK